MAKGITNVTTKAGSQKRERRELRVAAATSTELFASIREEREREIE